MKQRSSSIFSKCYRRVFTVLEIIFESVQQKHQDKTIFDQQVVNFVWKKKASLTNLYCTHLCIMRYTSNPLSYDYSRLIITLTVRLMYLFSITNQTICPVKCNFVRTKHWNGWKMANCWMLFRALFSYLCLLFQSNIIIFLLVIVHVLSYLRLLHCLFGKTLIFWSVYYWCEPSSWVMTARENRKKVKISKSKKTIIEKKVKIKT